MIITTSRERPSNLSTRMLPNRSLTQQVGVKESYADSIDDSRIFVPGSIYFQSTCLGPDSTSFPVHLTGCQLANPRRLKKVDDASELEYAPEVDSIRANFWLPEQAPSFAMSLIVVALLCIMLDQ